MAKIILLLMFCLPSLAQTPESLPGPWEWLRGEEAERELVMLNYELEKGIKGWKIQNEVVGLSQWLFMAYDDDTMQAPKSFRIRTRLDRHLEPAPPLEAYFTFQYQIGEIYIPLFTFGGEVHGISVRTNSPERFIYLKLKTVKIVPPNASTRWGQTVNIECEICDTARDFLSYHIYKFQNWAKDAKVLAVVRIPDHTEDRIEINVVELK